MISVVIVLVSVLWLRNVPLDLERRGFGEIFRSEDTIDDIVMLNITSFYPSFLYKKVND